MARPPRLRNFSYVGPLAVCFTSATNMREHSFLRRETALYCVEQLLQVAASHEVEVAAYCLMPDHVHVLALGDSQRAAPLAFFERWKQRTGFWHKQFCDKALWQKGYWERVLRAEDDIATAVRYIVANPIRGQLVEDLRDYPWVGSSRYSVNELATVCHDCDRPSWW